MDIEATQTVDIMDFVQLMALIKQKIERSGKAPPTSAKPRRRTSVIDLAAMLQESLNRSDVGRHKSPKSRKSKSRKAA